MTALVGLNIVVAAVLGVLAALCAAAGASLRRHAALGWMAGALTIGMVQTLIITFAPSTEFEFFSVAVLGPAAYLLAGQSIAEMVPSLPGRGVTIAVVTFLSAVSVLLHWLGAPFVAPALAFELACVVAVLDVAWRVGRPALARSRLLAALTLVVYGLALVTVLRLATLPMHVGQGATLPRFTSSIAEGLYLCATTFLTPIAIILMLARIITDTIATFQHQSEHDSLTGLFNRRMIDAMAAEVRRPGAVIFCDIDHFKRVNDAFGHQAGDRVICGFAKLLDETGHIAGRIGGEEFAILLPGWTPEEAAEIAEDIRIRFNDLEHADLPHDKRLSASFGVAAHRANEPIRKAFARADAALYAAKAAGRNRVVIHSDGPLPRSETERWAA